MKAKLVSAAILVCVLSQGALAKGGGEGGGPIINGGGYNLAVQWFLGLFG